MKKTLFTLAGLGRISFSWLLPASVSAFLLLSPMHEYQSRTANAPNIKVKKGTSSNWSGYAVYGAAGSVTEVKGSWTVPAVTGTTGQSSYCAQWVGIDGYSSNSVEQIGTESDYINGVARYYVWYEMYPKMSKSVNIAVSPGNAITADVKYLGSNQFKLTITNVTRGQSFTTTEKLPNAARSSAEWIVEAPSSGKILTLAKFGTVNFTGSSTTVNSVTGAISNFTNDRIDMVSGTQIIALTSALSSDGTGFSVTRQ
jgi:hypothetical protein